MLTRLSCLVPLTLLICTLIVSTTCTSANSANHELLTRLGMSRRRMPMNHHRKRLATESRHHGVNREDSHMFIIKLPPNPYYYSHLKPTKISNAYNSVNKVPVSFRANGKPARVYHWNIPVLKKIANNSRRKSVGSNLQAQDSKIYTIQKTSPWTHGKGNEAREKSTPMKQHRKSDHNEKPAVSYYAPANQRKTMIQKYFSGNGKPQSFYVIEKSKKPVYHQRLLTLNN
ncbi:uncharacterized protein LOC110826658 [Zootermopsis nevadensis]|uniref:uncharacterized protein LOC110826658 n=1 Tax=Zootermopsis nevadensis TaxID=136037 RepID=UPI000B8E97E1|nr:uncharacterized protein LOC110826658 [Zootermopsis nevadensis]